MIFRVIRTATSAPDTLEKPKEAQDSVSSGNKDDNDGNKYGGDEGSCDKNRIMMATDSVACE